VVHNDASPKEGSVQFDANHEPGLPQRLALVLAIEAGMTQKAGCCVTSRQ
jgi:hypothetical protein